MDAFASPTSEKSSQKPPPFLTEQTGTSASALVHNSSGGGDQKSSLFTLLPPGYNATAPLFEIDECLTSESLYSRTVDSQPATGGGGKGGGGPAASSPGTTQDSITTRSGASSAVVSRAGRGGAVAVLGDAPPSSSSSSPPRGQAAAAAAARCDTDESSLSATGTGTTHNTSCTSANASAVDLLSTDDILRVYRFSLGGNGASVAREGSAASTRGEKPSSSSSQSIRGTMSSMASVRSGTGGRGAGGSSLLATFGHSTVSHGTSTGTGGTTHGGNSVASRSFGTTPPQAPLPGDGGTGSAVADSSRQRVKFSHANPRESSCQSLTFVKRSSLIQRFGTSIFAALSMHESNHRPVSGPGGAGGAPPEARDQSTDCRSRVSSQGIKQGFRAFPSFSHAMSTHLNAGSTISESDLEGPVGFTTPPHTQRSPSAALQYLTPLVDGTLHPPEAMLTFQHEATHQNSANSGATAREGPLSRTSISTTNGVNGPPPSSFHEDMAALAKAYFTAQMHSQSSFSAAGEGSGSGDHGARPSSFFGDPAVNGSGSGEVGMTMIMPTISAASSRAGSPRHGNIPCPSAQAGGPPIFFSSNGAGVPHAPISSAALRSMSYFGGGLSVHDGDVSISTYGPTKLTATSNYFEEDDGFYILNNYILLQEAGRGQYGVVMIASDTNTEKTKAIKIIPKEKLKGKFRKVPAAQRRSSVGGSNSVSCSVSRASSTPPSTPPPLASEEETSAFEREIAVMKKLRHRNIVRLEEVIDDPNDDHLYLVMPYIERGPVVRIENGKCAAIDVHVVRAYMKQLLSAVAYLHRNQVVHCDIKPDNVLLGADGRIYLTDFGVSEMFTSDRSAGGLMMRATKGTPAFMAPETLSGALFDASQVDIWAIGVSFYVFLFGQLPFEGASIFELYRTIGKEPLDLCRAFRSRWEPVMAAMAEVEKQHDRSKRLSSVISFVRNGMGCGGGGGGDADEDTASGALIDFANVDLLDDVSSPFSIKKTSTSTTGGPPGGSSSGSGNSDGRRRSNNNSYFMVSMYEQTLGPGRRLSDVVEEDRARHRNGETLPALSASLVGQTQSQRHSSTLEAPSAIHMKPPLVQQQRGSSTCPSVVMVPSRNSDRPAPDGRRSNDHSHGSADSFMEGGGGGGGSAPPPPGTVLEMRGNDAALPLPPSTPTLLLPPPNVIDIPALRVDTEGLESLDPSATSPSSSASPPSRQPALRRRSSDTRSVVIDHVETYEAVYCDARCAATVRDFDLSSLLMELAVLEATYALTRAAAREQIMGGGTSRDDGGGGGGGQRRSSNNDTGLTVPTTARPPTAVFSDDNTATVGNENESGPTLTEEAGKRSRKPSSGSLGAGSDVQSEHSTHSHDLPPPPPSGESVRPLPSEAFFFVRGEQLGRQIRALMLTDAPTSEDDDDEEDEEEEEYEEEDDEVEKDDRSSKKESDRMKRLEERFLDGISMRIGALDLLRLLLHRDPMRRATAAESLRHPFIKYGSAVRQRYNSLSSANSSGGGGGGAGGGDKVHEKDGGGTVSSGASTKDSGSTRSPRAHLTAVSGDHHTSALTAAASTSNTSVTCNFSSSRFQFFMPRQPRSTASMRVAATTSAPGNINNGKRGSSGGALRGLDPEALLKSAGSSSAPSTVPLTMPAQCGDGGTMSSTRKRGTLFNTRSHSTRARGGAAAVAGGDATSPLPGSPSSERDGFSPVRSHANTVAGADAPQANTPTTIHGHEDGLLSVVGGGTRKEEENATSALDGCVLPMVALLPASPGSQSLSASIVAATATTLLEGHVGGEEGRGPHTSHQPSPPSQQQQHGSSSALAGSTSIGGRRGMVSFIGPEGVAEGHGPGGFSTSMSTIRLSRAAKTPSTISVQSGAAEASTLDMLMGTTVTHPHPQQLQHQHHRRASVGRSSATSIRASITAADVSQSTTRRNRAQESSTATTAIVQQWSHVYPHHQHPPPPPAPPLEEPHQS